MIRRALLPPLTIALAIVTAGTLLLTAAALGPSAPAPAVETPTVEISRVTPIQEAAVRFTDPLLAVDTTALVNTARVVLLPPPAVVTLVRLTYGRGSGGSSRALPGGLLLVVETGALTVRLEGTAQRFAVDRASSRIDGSVVLSAGDGLLLPAASAVSIRNGATAPVVAVAVGVFPAALAQPVRGALTSQQPVRGVLPRLPIEPAFWPAGATPGATVQSLAGGWLINATAGPASIALRRLSLPPEGTTSLTAPGALVLAVETGALTLGIDEGLGWQQAPGRPDEWIDPGSVTTLLTGDGAVLQDGPRLTLGNAGSAPLLVLALSLAPAA